MQYYFFASETQLGGEICDRIQSSVKEKITYLLELFLDRNRLLHSLQVSIGIQYCYLVNRRLKWSNF